MKMKNECEMKGYHDWTIISVNGTLPYQELDLECSSCQEVHTTGWEK